LSLVKLWLDWEVFSMVRPIGRDYVIDGLCKIVFDKTNYYMAYSVSVLEKIKVLKEVKECQLI